MSNEPRSPQYRPIRRRAVLKSVLFGIGATALGNTIWGCDNAATTPKGPDRKDDPAPPGNSDEFVPGESTPVNSPAPLQLPNQAWEARVKQLESEQVRLFRKEIYTAESPGTNKDAHVPNAVGVSGDGGTKGVKVVVNHVMGANLLDGGVATVYDSGGDANDAGDAGDAADAADADAAVTPTPPATPKPAHYITTIYVRAMVEGQDTVVGLWEFSANDKAPPTIIFNLPAGVTSATAYEWCTLHGLWSAAPVPV